MSGMKAVVIALALMSPAAFGATRTWISKHTVVWSNQANWDGGVPLAGDDVILTGSSTNDLSPAPPSDVLEDYADVSAVRRR